MALEDFYEKLVLLERKVISDGMGGFEETYGEGIQFLGAIGTDSSAEMRLAEQQGLKSIYTVTIDKNIPIAYHDIIKRVKDDKLYRITTDPADMETPTFSNLNFKQMSAEKWTI